MNCAELLDPPAAAENLDSESPAATAGNRVRLPMGLLGFEQIKDYVLLANPAEEPFAWLQVEANVSLAFVVIEPFRILATYQPEIPQADVDFLGLERPEDALVLTIVTINGPAEATANLKGPIVINRKTHVGKQVIIANAAQYSVRHPLPVK